MHVAACLHFSLSLHVAELASLLLLLLNAPAHICQFVTVSLLLVQTVNTKVFTVQKAGPPRCCHPRVRGSVLKHHSFVVVHDDPILDVPAHSARQHEALEIATLRVGARRADSLGEQRRMGAGPLLLQGPSAARTLRTMSCTESRWVTRRTS